MDLAVTLQQAQSADPALRQPAEQALQQAAETQPAPFMTALVGELGNNAREPAVRQLAGLYFKNMLKAEDEGMQQEKTERWLEQIPPADKGGIRANLLQNLLSEHKEVRHTGAQCIAAVAAIDIPQKPCQWPELLPAFQQVVLAPEVAEHSKEATLEACGYMCEELNENDLSVEQTNQVLTSIVDGIKAGRPETTRCAAVVALQNALEFCNNNFKNENERNMLMQSVCEACQSPEAKTRLAALECTASIAALYYEHLAAYIEAIYGLTTMAIKQAIATPDDDAAKEVGTMAIEFWSTIAEEEMELAELEDEGGAAEEGNKGHKFIDQITVHMVPVLLEAMTKQDDDEEADDNWNIPEAAAVCLELIANTVRDKIINHVIPFVSQNINNPDWHFKEAAIMAFGQVLEGPEDMDAFKTIIEQAIPQFLIQALRDPSVFVKDTTAWALSRVCQIHPNAVPNQYITGLVENLLLCLDDAPRVAKMACTCLHHMAENVSEIGTDTNWLATTFLAIVQKLFGVTERPDSDEFNLRINAYETINMMVENHPDQVRPTVLQIVPEVCKRLQATFQAQIMSADDRDEQDTLQALLVAALHMIIRALDSNEIIPMSDQIMELLLQVLMSKGSTASEEAFMAVGAVADKTEAHFARYLTHVMPVILAGLKNWEEYQVCGCAVGTVGDIARALGKVSHELVPYCDQLVEALLHDLENPQLNRQVKPQVLTAFGDLAMVLRGGFDKYVSITMGMLIQASATNVDESDEELLEFLDELREGVLDAYTGILNGLEEGQKQQMMLVPTNFIEKVMQFLEKVTNDVNSGAAVTKGAANLLGDIARILGPQNYAHAAFKAYFTQPYVNKLLQDVHNIDEDSAKYAFDKIKELTG